MARLKDVRICGACRQPKPASMYSKTTARKCDDCKAAGNPRPCWRCGQSKPSSEFVFGGRVCAQCRAEGYPCERRACFRCLEVKPPNAFPLGDGSKAKDPENRVQRRSHICIACRERKAAERAQRRTTWIDEPTGRYVRRCKKCGEVKDLERDFRNYRRPSPDLTLAQMRGYRCKPCQADDGHKHWLKKRQDPKFMERERAKWREQARRYRIENPEKVRANQERWMARKRQDPKWLEQYRELNRIAYRLRKEQHGESLPTASRQEIPDRRQYGWLPAAPLAVAVDRFIKREEAGNLWDDLPPSSSSDHTIGRSEIICERLGIPLRTLSAWRTGERTSVQFLVADRVLTHSGLMWWDVWNEDTTDEAGMEEVRAAFGVEEAAA